MINPDKILFYNLNEYLLSKILGLSYGSDESIEVSDDYDSCILANRLWRSLHDKTIVTYKPIKDSYMSHEPRQFSEHSRYDA